MFRHQVGASTGDAEQSLQHSQSVFFFFAHLLFYCVAVPSDQFSVRPCFPSSMNLLWDWQCGFLCRRLEYKYGFLCLELLFLLWYKSFPKTKQIGQVATWTALFAYFVFVGRSRFHSSESFSQTPDVQSTTCTITWLDEDEEEGKKNRKLGDYFSLWNWFCRGCRIAYFHSVSLGRIAHAGVSSFDPPPLWISLIPHQFTSLCLHIRSTRCIAWATLWGHWWGRLSVSGWQGFKVPAREAWESRHGCISSRLAELLSADPHWAGCWGPLIEARDARERDHNMLW